MNSKYRLPFLFFLVAVPTCLLLSIFVPPGQVPDEPAHISRAFAIASGQMIGYRGLAPGLDGATHTLSGVTASWDLFKVAWAMSPLTSPPQKITIEQIDIINKTNWDTPTIFFGLGSIASYFPALYLPGAFGIRITRFLGGKPFVAILSARLCNSAVFISLGFCALCFARRARLAIFFILTIPETLFLASSVSQDGLLIATATLAASLATRHASLCSVITAALTFCVAAAKPPYIFLCVLLFNKSVGYKPALKNEGRLKIGLSIAMVVGATTWALAMLYYVSARVERAPYHPGPFFLARDKNYILNSTDPKLQLSVLLDDPTRLATLPFTSMLHDPWLARQFLGILGWLNIILPEALYVLLGTSLICSLAYETLRHDDAGPTIEFSLQCVVAVLCSVWSIYITQYVAWTNVGMNVIDGVSGRYFIPLFPVVAISIPKIHGMKPSLLISCEIFVVVTSILAVGVLFDSIYATYYDMNSIVHYIDALRFTSTL